MLLSAVVGCYELFVRPRLSHRSKPFALGAMALFAVIVLAGGYRLFAPHKVPTMPGNPPSPSQSDVPPSSQSPGSSAAPPRPPSVIVLRPTPQPPTSSNPTPPAQRGPKSVGDLSNLELKRQMVDLGRDIIVFAADYETASNKKMQDMQDTIASAKDQTVKDAYWKSGIADRDRFDVRTAAEYRAKYWATEKALSIELKHRVFLTPANRPDSCQWVDPEDVAGAMSASTLPFRGPCLLDLANMLDSDK